MKKKHSYHLPASLSRAKFDFRKDYRMENTLVLDHFCRDTVIVHILCYLLYMCLYLYQCWCEALVVCTCVCICINAGRGTICVCICINVFVFVHVFVFVSMRDEARLAINFGSWPSHPCTRVNIGLLSCYAKRLMMTIMPLLVFCFSSQNHN